MSETSRDSMENNVEATMSSAVSSPLEQINSRVSSILDADWNSYYRIIMALPRSFQIAPSLKLLNAADALINQNNSYETGELVEPISFEDSHAYQRAMLAGLTDQQTKKHYSFDTSLLGNMESFASFKKIVKNDAAGIKRLLKIIPAHGKIDGWHFMQFVDAYQALFAKHGFKQTHLFPATRLLAMRRPDQFFSISSNTVDAICHSFAIKPLKKQDFQRYWDDVIGTIQKTTWFKSEAYQISETGVFRARVALLERLFYPGEVLAEQDETHYQTPSESIATSDQSDNFGTTKLTDSTSRANSNETEKLKNNGSLNIINPDRANIENRVATQLKQAKQPKKMTIAKRKSAKVNRNAATKLMSQYYFANKSKYPAAKIKLKRESIIDQLVNGESVEQAFESVMQE